MLDGTDLVCGVVLTGLGFVTGAVVVTAGCGVGIGVGLAIPHPVSTNSKANTNTTILFFTLETKESNPD